MIELVCLRAMQEDILAAQGLERAGSEITRAAALDDALGLTPRGMKALGWTVETPTADVDGDLVALDDFRSSVA